MLSNLETDDDLEHKIKFCISNNIKAATGKGPIKTKVILFGKMILISISGFLTFGDLKVAETEEGLLYVKDYHSRRINALKEDFCQQISHVIGMSVRELFYDVNAKTNEGVIVIYLN